MAAAPDAPVVESVNLAEAVAMISEAAEEPAVPEASQGEGPAGRAYAAEEAPVAQEGEVARLPADVPVDVPADLPSEAREASEGGKKESMVKPHGGLVSVSFTPHGASTPDLSTW